MGLLGLLVILFLALFVSSNRKQLCFQTLLCGLLLQFALAFILLKTPLGTHFFDLVTAVVSALSACSEQGAGFVFGDGFREHFFAFAVLSTVVFLSSLTSVLFYWGILQKIILIFAFVMRKSLKISGAEALAAAANIFVGQIEAPLFIKASIPSISKSQLLTVMICGMATISGSLLAVYSQMGINAGHLLAATILSAPAAIVIAKILEPSTNADSNDCIKKDLQNFGENVVDAACSGAQQGLKIAFAIAACVLCFVAFTALINQGLVFLPDVSGAPLSLERMLSTVFRPVSWLIGIPWDETPAVATLLGKKLIFNEFVAYADFSNQLETLSPRTALITTYALCGFSNISSIAIQIGGLSAIAPERRGEISILGFKALFGGTLATLMTACIAGLIA